MAWCQADGHRIARGPWETLKCPNCKRAYAECNGFCLLCGRSRPPEFCSCLRVCCRRDLSTDLNALHGNQVKYLLRDKSGVFLDIWPSWNLSSFLFFQSLLLGSYSLASLLSCRASKPHLMIVHLNMTILRLLIPGGWRQWASGFLRLGFKPRSATFKLNELRQATSPFANSISSSVKCAWW